MPKVLISDKMSAAAREIFQARGISVDVTPGLERNALIKIIKEYDGLAVRSSTKVTAPLIEAATRLRVIGRAGIGVDNIDLVAATTHGIVVMNTPFGNSITTAEHAIAMMLSLAREIPLANASTHAGKWEKNRFLGVEVTGKTLGIIGCGNIGQIVAHRAQGLAMRVLACDPFLTHKTATDIGCEKVDLDALFTRADFISLHTPLTDKTRNIIDATAISKMRKNTYIINCARGGLIDEAALKDALDNKHIAGVALDVFENEPVHENILFNMDKVICTPHLGAATSEAQENVAVQVAEQMSDFLTTGAVQHAINMPSITAEEAPRLNPWIKLAEQLGSFAGQNSESEINTIAIDYAGDVSNFNLEPITAAAIAGFLRPILGDSVNIVNAPEFAKERGIKITTSKLYNAGAFDNYIRFEVKGTTKDKTQKISCGGTVFSDGKPRIIQVDGINMEAELSENVLYVKNNDAPGFIGELGSALGKHKINIASFSLGRKTPDGAAISLISIDSSLPDGILDELQALPKVVSARLLQF